MSDGPALRAAICANPADDTPRLVYADWLEEHDTPATVRRTGRAAPGANAKRAAFVRDRVQLARLEAADAPARALAAYVTRLLNKVERIDWTALDPDLAVHVALEYRLDKSAVGLTPKGESVPKVRGVSFEGWRRGFYDTVIVSDPDRFLAHADDVFRAVPVERARFAELTEEQARALVAAGHLARFRALSFGYGVEPDALRVLGRHRDAAGVARIEFDEEGTDANVEALAAGTHWTGVRALHLIDLESSDDPPEDEQCAELFARPWCRGLQELIAWGSQLGRVSVRALATKCPDLRHLDLGLNGIESAGARALAESKTLRRLRYLDVGSCDIEGGDAQAALIVSPNLPALAVLVLGGNGSNGPSAKALAKAGRGPGLRALEVNACSSAAAGALAACPELSGLYLLTFDGGGLSDESAARYFRAPNLDRLAYLDLSYSGIGPKGARALAAWPGAASIQWLNLSENKLTIAGVRALVDSPHLTNLRYLDASGRGLATLKKHFGKVTK